MKRITILTSDLFCDSAASKVAATVLPRLGRPLILLGDMLSTAMVVPSEKRTVVKKEWTRLLSGIPEED